MSNDIATSASTEEARAEYDAREAAAFRAGLEAAASWHDDRAKFTGGIVTMIEGDPASVPDDVRDDLIEYKRESASQDRADARYIRGLTLPASMGEAAHAAEAALLAQHAAHVEQEREGRRLARANGERARMDCDALRAERDALRAVLCALRPCRECRGLATVRGDDGKVYCDACSADFPNNRTDLDHAAAIRALAGVPR